MPSYQNLSKHQVDKSGPFLAGQRKHQGGGNSLLGAAATRSVRQSNTTNTAAAVSKPPHQEDNQDLSSVMIRNKTPSTQQGEDMVTTAVNN